MFHHLPSRARCLLLACTLLLFSALVHAQQVLRVTAIPDESPTELVRKAEPLMKDLAGQRGLKVEYTPVTDDAAALETLVNRKVDLAWFGGFTFVQAHVRSGGKSIPLVQREEDARFRSVFITTNPTINTLADLTGKDVSFGSASSTPGHVLPRSFLLQAGVNPENDFRRVAFSGAHDATIAAVAAGKLQAGALNIAVCEKFVADAKVDPAKEHVFFTTPPHCDYNWTVQADLTAAPREKLTQAPLRNGATRQQAFTYGLLPQNAAELTSNTVYRRECAIRSSVVMGFVGASGFGQQRDSSLKMHAGGEELPMLVVFIVPVALADRFSAALLKALD